MTKSKKIEEYVNRKIEWLLKMAESGEGKADLALLRKSIGKEPGEIPQLFGVIMKDLPEEFMTESGIPTKEEWACHVPLTLFALHQQGHDASKEKMHTSEKVSLGSALRRLKEAQSDENAEERMLKRLQAIVTEVDVKGMAYRLRQVITTLSANSISLNYGMLANDLYSLQFNEAKYRISLKWGQDFYRFNNDKEKSDNE